MEAFLQTLGIYIWKFIEDGYIVPKYPPIDGFGKKFYECNAKYRNAIVCGLNDSKFTKVI